MHTPLQEIFAVRQATTMARYDIYARIHKGIRLMLGDIQARAGRVAHDDPAALEDLARRVEGVIALCESHLAHENAFIHPALEAVQPGASARIAAEHVEHERDLQALRTHARALAAGTGIERAAACRAMYLALGLFAAHNLVHMHLEETEHNAVLWAHYGDDEIAAIEGRLIAHLTPPEMMSAMRWMLPALPAADREGGALLGRGAQGSTVGVALDRPPWQFGALDQQ